MNEFEIRVRATLDAIEAAEAAIEASKLMSATAVADVLLVTLQRVTLILSGNSVQGAPVHDERVILATAAAAHSWAAENGLKIRCPFWGSGDVVTPAGVPVPHEMVPEFVRDHIAFMAPDQD